MEWGCPLSRLSGVNWPSLQGAGSFLDTGNQKNVIPFNEWLDEMTKIASYERLTFRLNDREEEFLKLWGPYLKHLSKDG